MAGTILSLVLILIVLNAVQCNFDLVTLLVSAKTVPKSHNVTKSNDFCSKLKNGQGKIKV